MLSPIDQRISFGLEYPAYLYQGLALEIFNCNSVGLLPALIDTKDFNRPSRISYDVVSTRRK
jgi:hypothetical protein